MLDRELRGREALDYLREQKAELEAAWQERHDHHRRGATIPEVLERRYWTAVVRILYVGAHLEQQDGGGTHIPPGVAVEAAQAIWSALQGHPSPVFDRKGGTAPSPDVEADERIAAELVMLSGYGGRPRWIDLPGDFVDRVADAFGVSRTSVTRWVQKYGQRISGDVRAAIEQRVAAGAYPTREAAAEHDLKVAAEHFRAWRHDAQRRKKAVPKSRRLRS